MTVLVVALVVLTGLALALFWPRPPLGAAPTFHAAPPTHLVCSGYVDSRQGPLLLLPARAGRVVTVFAQQNQTVSKDAPLVQLDDRDVELQEKVAGLAVQAAELQLTRARDGLKQYRARQAEAEAALEAAQSKLLAAQYALNHAEELLKKQLAGTYEAEVARARLDEARALVRLQQHRLTEIRAVDPALEVKLARSELERGQAGLQRARREREEHLLRAPVEGVVLRVQAQEGDLLGPSSPRPAVWLAPAGAWVIRAEVSQEFADRVQAGLGVQVEDEDSGSDLARGRIAEVSDWFLPRRQFDARPTSINTGLTLECVIELQERHAPLRLGQRVRVRVFAAQPAG
jgi:multidrug resistance efflux pump